MFKPADARRRWWGATFLTSAVALLIWGQTLLKPLLVQSELVFLTYWLLCFLFTGLAIFTALLDVRAVRRQAREQQLAMVGRVLREVERAAEEKSHLPHPQNQQKT